MCLAVPVRIVAIDGDEAEETLKLLEEIASLSEVH
jgi:hydrogenase maturation factor